MNKEEFIKSIADITESTTPRLEGDKIYVSKVDGSYISHVGMEDRFDMFLRFGITEQIQSCKSNGKTACIGFNPIENEWYGWSHRAIYGFTIGSECKKGNCHYQPKNKKDFIEDCNNFWNDVENNNVANSREYINDEGIVGVLTVFENKEQGKISSVFTKYPDTFGKGEWVAKTMDDAKQMAIDFAEGVG